jgi:hypothetical protein
MEEGYSPERLVPTNKLHGITSQKTVMLVVSFGFQIPNVLRPDTRNKFICIGHHGHLTEVRLFVCLLVVCVTQLKRRFSPDVTPIKSLTAYECNEMWRKRRKGTWSIRNEREEHLTVVQDVYR